MESVSEVSMEAVSKNASGEPGWVMRKPRKGLQSLENAFLLVGKKYLRSRRGEKGSVKTKECDVTKDVGDSYFIPVSGLGNAMKQTVYVKC